MSAKAYLLIRFNTATVPPVVVGAEIASGPLTSRTLSGYGEEQWVELFHVRGNTQQVAEKKLLGMVGGWEPCPFGDLRFLWNFIDPSKDGHNRRYGLNKRIELAVSVLRESGGNRHGTVRDDDGPLIDSLISPK